MTKLGAAGGDASTGRARQKTTRAKIEARSFTGAGKCRRGKFKGAPVNHLALGVLYPNIMHVVTVAGSGITKMSDLKGKRVSTGSPGSATEVMAFRVIEAAGLDKDKDMTRERLGVAARRGVLDFAIRAERRKAQPPQGHVRWTAGGSRWGRT